MLLNKNILFYKIFLISFIFLMISCHKEDKPYTTWSVYRGDAGSTGYSALNQINKNTVKNLEVAWTYHTRDAATENHSTIQCNPIIANGMMYVTSPKLQVIAIEPATGKEIWKFNPFKKGEASGVNRGVTYWERGNDKRIFIAASSFLYAINADTGQVISEFGTGGKIDLRNGLGRSPEKLSVWATSPGIIYNDILIQGTALNEGYDSAPGFIRGYNVYTGAIVWTFHTIPQPGEYGYDTWQPNAYKNVGGTNCWAGMCLDQKRGTVFIPLGSPAFDFYGGNRKGQNLYGNCLLALDATTGKRRWHYQMVHHDLWDYDIPSPPTLLTVNHKGKKVDAVVQVTKMGMVFLFNRETGKPLFPIEERSVPKSDLLGEETWVTQPFPVKPLPYVRHRFSEEDITNISPEANKFIKEKIKGAKFSTIYTPPSLGGTVQFPGTRGGSEWGGASVDLQTGVLYVNANQVPMLFKMKELETDEGLSLVKKGENVFAANNCSVCHGADRSGVKPFPSLINIKARLTKEKISTLLLTGRNQMPPFPNLKPGDKAALLSFLMDEKVTQTAVKKKTVPKDKDNIKYIHDGWNVLLDQDEYPGVKPPWGTLNAIDMNTGEYLWQVPLGEFAALTKKGIPPTGTQNLGGSVVTAGGLVFIAATKDEMFRAFDKTTGKIVWQYKLPAGGYATPSTYLVDGEQYIVIAAGGGGKVGSKSGDSYIAFKLKKN